MISIVAIGPRSSGDRAPPSGGGSAGSNPAGGGAIAREVATNRCTNRPKGPFWSIFATSRDVCRPPVDDTNGRLGPSGSLGPCRAEPRCRQSWAADRSRLPRRTRWASRRGVCATVTCPVRHTGCAGRDPTEDLARLAEATRLVLPVGSAFSHLTAARMLGLPVPRRWAPTEPLHVMNVTAAPKIRRAGCEGHRGLESRRVVTRTGLRVVSPEDTWCDLAATGNPGSGRAHRAGRRGRPLPARDPVRPAGRGGQSATGRSGQAAHGRGAAAAEAAQQLADGDQGAAVLPARGVCPSRSSTSSSTTGTRANGSPTRTSSGASRGSWPSSTATITAQIGSNGRTTWPGARTSRTTDGPSSS